MHAFDFLRSLLLFRNAKHASKSVSELLHRAFGFIGANVRDVVATTLVSGFWLRRGAAFACA